MKKTIKQKPQDEQPTDILKRIAKRVEETTIDISNMKSDLKMVSLRLSGVEHNTEIMKVDVEKIKFDISNAEENLVSKLVGLESRLNKRITYVTDLITIEFGGKLRNHDKRIRIYRNINARNGKKRPLQEIRTLGAL